MTKNQTNKEVWEEISNTLNQIHDQNVVIIGLLRTIASPPKKVATNFDISGGIDSAEKVFDVIKTFTKGR